MKPSEIHVLPGELRLMAEAIENLPDLDTMPPLYALKLAVDYASGSLALRAQLQSGEDFAVIADLNAWAAAIGGSLLLGDEYEDTYDGTRWRPLSVLKRLPGGLLFEVWSVLRYHAPAETPELATA